MAYRSSLAELPDIMTPRQAADLLGVSVRSIYHYCRAGNLPSFRIGHKMFIPKSGIQDKMEGYDGQGV